MRFNDLVQTSLEVGKTRSRLKKRYLLEACLRVPGPDELPLVVDFLAGILPQGRIGLGPALFRDLDAGPPAAKPRLEGREIGRDANVVHVKPELVVEIAVNDLQASDQYPAELALRFARVKRYRRDKRPEESDRIETVQRFYVEQTGLDAPAGFRTGPGV
jgi:hypothetical protein